MNAVAFEAAGNSDGILKFRTCRETTPAVLSSDSDPDFFDSAASRSLRVKAQSSDWRLIFIKCHRNFEQLWHLY